MSAAVTRARSLGKRVNARLHERRVINIPLRFDTDLDYILRRTCEVCLSPASRRPSRIGRAGRDLRGDLQREVNVLRESTAALRV